MYSHPKQANASPLLFQKTKVLQKNKFPVRRQAREREMSVVLERNVMTGKREVFA
jgi:hypothetical protein